MKKVLMVVLSLAVMVFMVGCLTSEQQARMDSDGIKLTETLRDLDKYRAQAKVLLSRVKAGDMTVVEAKEIFDELREDIQEATDTVVAIKGTIDDLRSEGVSGKDIAQGALVSLFSIVTSLLGVRGWRGSVNNRMGDIGVRKPSEF